MKYKEYEYLSFDPCDGDMLSPGDYIMLRKKIVKTRKPHQCHISLIEEKPHMTLTGSFARYEVGIFEGNIETMYCCIKCIDKWIEEMESELTE